MKQCEICNIAFESGRSFSNHVRWVHKETKYRTQECSSCGKQIAQCGLAKHQKTCATNKKICKFCKKEFFSRTNIFCNNSCAASFNNVARDPYERSYITPEWKDRQSFNTKKNWTEGKFSIARRLFSSKKEREIVSYFKENYPRDQWKSGGRLKLNDAENLSRDMWSDVIKVCFEFDGIWHFKDIHGQLKRKQMKDILLEEWCIKNNYRLIRIDEDCFESVEQIRELIYNRNEPIIKIGKKYNAGIA